MKRILLCTALLILTGFCGQSAQAAYTMYTVSAKLNHPTYGDTYDCAYGYTKAHVPVSVTDQWVNVSGDPSTIITLRWSMVDYATKMQDGGDASTVYAASDWSNGPTQIGIDVTGNWRRYVNNNGTGNLSTTVSVGGGSYTFCSGSLLQDWQDQTYRTSESVQFSVDYVT